MTATVVTDHQRRIAFWISLTVAVFAVGFRVISTIVGWNASSASGRVLAASTIPVAAVVAFAGTRVLLIGGFGLYRRYAFHDDKVTEIIDAAIAEGLLPTSYPHERARDRKVARTLRYDRKIGLRKADIRHDLKALYRGADRSR